MKNENTRGAEREKKNVRVLCLLLLSGRCLELCESLKGNLGILKPWRSLCMSTSSKNLVAITSSVKWGDLAKSDWVL